MDEVDRCTNHYHHCYARSSVECALLDGMNRIQIINSIEAKVYQLLSFIGWKESKMDRLEGVDEIAKK